MAGIEKKSLKESAFFSDNKSDEPRVKKPRTSDSSDTESLSSSEKSSENDSDRPYVLDRSDSPQIPCVLSKWNRRSLELLNINVTFDYDASPLQIFDLIETRKSFLETVQRIRVLMARSSFTQWMKILEMQTSNFTEPNLSSLDQIWPLFRDDLSNSFIPRPDPADIDIPEHLMLWFTRFHAFGKQFVDEMYEIMMMKEKKQPIFESHYQFLFKSFAAMFGMTTGVSFVPCLTAEVQHIGNTEVHGAPDLVYYTRRCVKQEQVVAVVEVKRERGIMKEFSVSPPSSKTRNKLKEKEMEFAVSSSSNTEKLRPHISKIMGHLDDNLIGQHGGELLFLSQNSFRENKVFGIIVQETMVTFTALNIGKKQFENIVSGEFFHKKDQEASLVISKPYDYLKESDREIVSEVLITLGMYQRKM